MGVKERKVREKEQRRDDIISAGEKLFLKKGLHGTTVDEIARECELSKGTLYLYFSSKEQLYLTIILKSITILHDMMIDRQDAAADPVSRLKKIGEAHLDFYNSYPVHFKLLSTANLIDPENFISPDLNETGMQIFNKNRGIWDLMSGIISGGIKSGLFREDTDPMEVSISLWGISEFIINVMDHVKKNSAIDFHQNDMPLQQMDFMKSLHLNGARIVYSILKNRPPDYDFYSGLDYQHTTQTEEK